MSIDNLDYFIGTALLRKFNQSFGYSDFTEEELSQLISLKISTTTSINGIGKLKNLEDLCVVIFDQIEYQYDGIIDYSELESLPKLKTLIIANNLHITKLDLSNLLGLESLILVSNANLREIVGLEKLKKLMILLK